MSSEFIGPVSPRSLSLVERLQHAYRIGTDVAAVSELHMLVETVVCRIYRDLRYQNVSLYAVDGEMMVFLGSAGPKDTVSDELKFTEASEQLPSLSWKIGEYVTGYAALHGEMVLVPDVSQDARYLQWVTPGNRCMRSELALPLKLGERVLGVLNVESATCNAFTEEDQQILGLLSGQIAVAFENVRLHREARTHVEELKDLNRALNDEITERQQAEASVTQAFQHEKAMSRMRDLILAVRNFWDLFHVMRDQWMEELKNLGIPIHGFSLQFPSSQPGYYQHVPEVLAHGTPPPQFLLEEYPWVNEAWDSMEPVVAPRKRFEGLDFPYIQWILEAPLPGMKGSVGLNSRASYTLGIEDIRIIQQFTGLLAEGLLRVCDFELLEQRTEDLSRSNRELEQFAYVASHDLQEPLRMVTGYLGLLKKRYADRLDTNAHEFIAYAVDGATRMSQLINDILTYSRVGTRGKSFDRADCGVVIDRVILNLRSVIQEKDAIVTHDALPTVMADEVQLGQLFQNLIGNAMKFHGARRPEIHVGAERSGAAWVFSVRDNGIGMADKDVDRIFDIFQRLHGKEEYPGTGIGLAVCKRIVERHGGRIWVESVPGEGSTFFFTIPDTGDTVDRRRLSVHHKV